jgi:AcrR family transcriptional regulator
MTTDGHQRRQPVQGRSRQTVARILDAAADLIEEDGVEAATTRAIAERAGVAYPSLYRFFADREEILAQLLERHLADLDAFVEATERTWQIISIEDLVNRELDVHIAYYRHHPGFVRLWYNGRTSRTVVAQVRRRNRPLAKRMQDILVSHGLISADTDPQVVLLMVELGDRILEVAFRDRTDPDRNVIEVVRKALQTYAEYTLAPPSQHSSPRPRRRSAKEDPRQAGPK